MPLLCLYVPRFTLACELADRPELEGAAVAVVEVGGSAVLEMSAEAESHGVRREMPLRQASGYCPTLSAVEARPQRYAEVQEALLAGLQQFTPQIEALEPGKLFGDVGGLDLHYPNQAELARAVLAKTPPALRAQVGIATRKFTAEVAAQLAEPGWHLIVPPDGEQEFLARQQLTQIALEEDLHRRLALFGLQTLGDIGSIPRAAWVAQLGTSGAWLWDAVNGVDPSPLQPHAAAASIVEVLCAEPPLLSRPSIEHGLRQLLSRIVRRPETQGRLLRTLGLWIALENEHIWERTYVLREPTGSAERLWRSIGPRLDAVSWSAPVTEMRVAVLELSDEDGRQFSLFAERARRRSRLQAMMQELQARYRITPIKQLVEVEPWHRLPERRYALLDYDP